MSFSGTYNMTINTPMGKQEGKLTLLEEGGALSGTMASNDGSKEIANPAIDGDTASWSVDVTKPMPLTLSFEGKKDGDKIVGSVKLGSFGKSTFEAVPA